MIFVIFSALAWAAPPPAPFPVFLKAGFSSVLEFDEAPARIVLGDPQKFQVEKLEHSLVVKTLAPFGATNMFVYFRDTEPRLFVLTASEDAQPTFYKSFATPAPPPKPAAAAPMTAARSSRGARLISARFDAKKDFLTIECAIRAGDKGVLHPAWPLARMRYSNSPITPFKLWAERKDVQKNAEVRARFVFVKPNVPRSLAGAFLVIPLEGTLEPIRISLKGGRR